MIAATAVKRAHTGGEASGRDASAVASIAEQVTCWGLPIRHTTPWIRCGVTSGVREDGAVATRSILHVDMDAFYVSVELARNPELRGKPVVVGGTGRRGVVAAASYEARAFGVFSAMPSAQAQRLCPHAIFLAGDHDRYGDVSRRVMAVFRDITPLVEPLSLDEAFLDVSGTLRTHGTAPRIAELIRSTIWTQEGLTCSVGIAPNKFLAKLGSERAKPKASPTGPIYGRGIFEIVDGEELDFLHPMSVRSLWGVGPSTGKRLASLGIETVRDLAEMPLGRLTAALGQANGRHLHDLAHARDDRPVEPDRETKSISHEETFAHDMTDRSDVDVELVRQADAVARRLRKHNLAARTVQLKVRHSDFDTVTRRSTSSQPFTSAATILQLVRPLLDQVELTRGVRLLGVGVANLLNDPGQQLSLALDTVEGGTSEAEVLADRVVDEVRERFGAGAIGPASSAVDGVLRVKRRGEQQWGPNSDDGRPSDGSE